MAIKPHTQSNNDSNNDSYNKWGWVTLIGCVFISIFLLIYFLYLQTPIDLGEEEQINPLLLAEASKLIDISQVKDYWISSDLMVDKGAQIYQQYCALCHGVTGKGDGMAGKGLKPPPRDFTKGDWKHGGTSKDIFNIITNGSDGTSMASFSHVPKLERWALVHFVRSLTDNKIEDDMEELKVFAESAD